MSYILSKKSLAQLSTVDLRLQGVVKQAIKLSNQDFAVFEGLRTLERQKQYVARGVSKTLSSKHLTGRAVDLVAWVRGSYSWEEKYYYDIAEAVRRAAIELNVDIVWGAVWNKVLNNLGDLKQSVKYYVSYRKAMNKSAFLDFPHFELLGA